MTAAGSAATVPKSSEDQTPEAVSRAIARLLRSQPAPSGPGVDDVQRAAWFTRRAVLLDQIVSAAAHRWPAVEAAAGPPHRPRLHQSPAPVRTPTRTPKGPPGDQPA